MTAQVSSQAAYLAMLNSGLGVSSQTSYAALLPSQISVSSQTTYLAMFDESPPANAGKRRNACIIS